jgi:hypothetical protein
MSISKSRAQISGPISPVTDVVLTSKKAVEKEKDAWQCTTAELDDSAISKT